MGRFRWMTIVDVSAFQEAYLLELVECSYRKALSRLSKRMQREIGGEETSN